MINIILIEVKKIDQNICIIFSKSHYNLCHIHVFDKYSFRLPIFSTLHKKTRCIIYHKIYDSIHHICINCTKCIHKSYSNSTLLLNSRSYT